MLGSFGTGDWTRTSDTRIMIPLLYQLSYAGTTHKLIPLNYLHQRLKINLLIKIVNHLPGPR